MACILQQVVLKDYFSVFKLSVSFLVFTFFMSFEATALAEKGSDKPSEVRLEGQVSHFHTDKADALHLNRDLLELQEDMSRAQVGSQKEIQLEQDLLELKEDLSQSPAKELEAIPPDYDSMQLHSDISSDTMLQNSVHDDSLELKIEWNQWRNRVAKKLWEKFNTLLIGGDAFYLGPLLLKYGEAASVDIPIGTKTHYSYQITRDRQIVNVRIEKSSGNRKMDNLILRSLSSLNRKGFLRFPKDSQRQIVTMRGNMEISKSAGFEKIDYGDVESVIVSY